VTAANNKGVTLFGLDDTRCWTGQNAASSYGIYGIASGRCGSTKGGLRYGFLASETVFVYEKKGGDWEPIECYSNVSPEAAFALPDSFDSKVSAKAPDRIFDYCKEKAENNGYKIFGADDKSCWTGRNAKSTYKKYGESKLCDFSKKTGNGSGKTVNGDVFVYELA